MIRCVCGSDGRLRRRQALRKYDFHTVEKTVKS